MPNFKEKILEQAVEYNLTAYEIRQAYVGQEGRVRSRNYVYKDGKKLLTPEMQYIFTYKHSLTNRKGALELEMDMSKHDFDLAWTEEAKCKLSKLRIVIPCSWGEKWEIDFFNDERNSIYLAMAECEVFDDRVIPIKVPDLVSSNLAFAVPEEDKRFKNKKLASPIYTRKLLEKISKEIIDV